jgi:hypothetical protein
MLCVTGQALRPDRKAPEVTMSVRTTTLEQDYKAARKVARSTTDLNARGRAEDLANRIALQARNLGTPLDEITLDEAVRLELYPTAPAKPRITGYTVTGLPIYSS